MILSLDCGDIMTSEVVLRFARFALKHWKEILLGALVVLVIGKFRYDYKQLEAAYEVSQESLEMQIEGLKSTHQKEIERREEALSDYKDKLAELERVFLESQLELERQRGDNRRQHVEDFSGNREKLIEDIKDVYGFTYVP